MDFIYAFISHRVIRNMIKILFTVVLFSVFTSTQATVYYVKTFDDGGNDANSGLDWSKAKETINAAIGSAANGDQIWVAAGTYAEHVVIDEIVGEAVKNVALYGGFYGTENELIQRDISANETTLDGTKTGTVVTIGTEVIGPFGASDLTRVDGFTITNGKPAGFNDSGGGIWIKMSAPVIANNLIRNNETSGGLGGGILVEGAQVVPPYDFQHPVIQNNRILENRAFGIFGDGGGIALKNSDALVTGNLIVRNQANVNGGGIAVRSSGDPRIIGNVVVANTAGWLNPWEVELNRLVTGSCWVGGGGIFAAAVDEFCYHAFGATVSPLIANNLIAANGAFQGGGILIQQNGSTAVITNNTIVANSGAGLFWEQAGVEVYNNLLAFNTAGVEQSKIGISMSTAILQHNNIYGNSLQQETADYLGITEATGQSGNISADPLLANLQSGHFHLRPESPCIDAGDNTVVAIQDLVNDIEGDQRILNGTIDIGADESTGEAWNSSPPVVYVDPEGDNSDGLSWTTAKTSLAEAVDIATSASDIAILGARGGEVWVSNNGGDPYYGTIEVPAFIQLYGGFTGNETVRSQRDPTVNQTFIDGSGEMSVIRFGNSGYRVSRLDGFTVQRGGLYRAGIFSTEVSDYKFGMGAGITSWIGGPEIVGNLIQENAVGSPFATPFVTDFERGAGLAGYISTAVIEDNVLQHNEVWDNIQGSGGAMYFSQSWPTIIGNTMRQNHAEHGAGIAIYGGEGFLTKAYIVDNLIEQNTGYILDGVGLASAYGGGIYCFACGDFEIERNLLRENFATEGSAMYIASSPRGRIESNLFERNNALATGIEVYAGGGVRLLATMSPIDNADIRVVNNTFVGHQAILGGAISIELAYDNVVVANNIVADNSSGIQTNTPWMPPRVLDYNLFSGNGINYVNLTAGASDLFEDPEFVDEGLGDYRLTGDSPAIDTGSPIDLPLGTIDLDKVPRIQDADHDGIDEVDIGAFEFSADFDGDLVPDWIDEDDDNDGVIDTQDAFPFDPTETTDSDGDGIGDNSDPTPFPPSGDIQFNSIAYSINENGSTVQLTVSRVNGSYGEVTVDFSSTDVTAIASKDYQAVSGTLIFADGVVSQTIDVMLIDDADYEGDEVFNVVLNNIQGGQAGSPLTAAVTIIEDDPAPIPGLLQFRESTYSVIEGSLNVSISVERVSGSAGEISVDFATEDGIAIAGEDYQANSGTLVFSENEIEKIIIVTLLDDIVYEGDENFTIELKNVQGGAALGTPIITDVNITDNEPAPLEGVIQFSTDTYFASETDTDMTITLNRVNGSDGEVSVDYSTTNGSAVSGEDYESASGTLVFANGVSSQTFKISLLDDAYYEGDELLTIQLNNIQGGASLGTPALATVIITDDDPIPTAGIIQFSGNNYRVVENELSCLITILRVNGSAGEVSVDYSTANDSAMAGEDYQSVSGTLVFAVGEISSTINVPVLDDSVYEGDETFTLHLSNVQGGAELGNPVAVTVTIINDDVKISTTSSGGGGGGCMLCVSGEMDSDLFFLILLILTMLFQHRMNSVLRK